jgi:hypothetical protein
MGKAYPLGFQIQGRNFPIFARLNNVVHFNICQK